ncbi:protein rolling stone-like [Babylonia areolata]|uniref:protein rolling stone-like n=1 Tax=Babylonia areolata TaxID=304850 RepID=UPI003FD409E3
MACPSLRNEFRLRMFGFSGVKAERFCYSQWRMPVAVYLMYRFLLMSYGVCWLVYISVEHGDAEQAWGAYLTIWTYILLNIYLIAHFLAASVHHALTIYESWNVIRCSRYLCHRPSTTIHARMFTELNGGVSPAGYEAIPSSEAPDEAVVEEPEYRPPWYLCAVWVLFSAVSSAAVMVTFVFFVFLFPSMKDYPHINLENLQEHLLNSIIIIVEHLVSASPYRLLHVVYPFVYGVVYLAFSVIYWAGDHKRVMYPILDWNKPGPTVGYVFMVGFVFIPLLHLFFFLVHKLKIAVYRRGCVGNDGL